jgi:hypothetical protein
MERARRVWEWVKGEVYGDMPHNVLSNVLEIKVAVIAKDKTGESDQPFSEWWVYVDEILGFDIL